MAYEGPMKMLEGVVAGAGLSLTSAQYKFVKLSADRTVVLCDALTDAPVGVLQAPAKEGEAVLVAYMGVTKVKLAAGAPAANDIIGTDADGQALTISIPSLTYYTAGRLLEVEGATDSGVIGTALIDCAVPSRAA